MPSVTYDGQSLFVKGRRAWLVGAGLEYSLVPRREWGHRLDELRRAGANTVVASVPWLRHEARPGRFDFSGGLDLEEFLRLCESRRLWVVLRIGPAVGEPFDGGGIPSWVIESGAGRLREWDERFLEKVSAIYRQAIPRAAKFQASELRDAGPRQVGPVVAFAIEHRWLCDHHAAGQRYLSELVRFARECGASVPLLTSNQLWQTLESAIDCWEGCESLLANLRQLRTVQPDFPRISLLRDPSLASVWGGGDGRGKALAALPRRVAEILASGAMPLLLDAVGGVHRHRGAGRRLGVAGEPPGAFFASVEPRGLLLDAHGRPLDGDADLRRILRFASSFGAVFAEAEPAYQPIAVDPGESGVRRHRASSTLSLRGPGGQVAFLFAEDPSDRRVTLCLDDGRSLPVDLGDSPVGWFVREVDLRGRGRLDYSSLSPLAIVARRLLVLFGPAGQEGFLAIDGNHIDLKVPAKGAKPLVVPHREILVVVLNEAQSRAAVEDGPSLLVGCRGFDASGVPIAAAGFSEFLRVALDGSISREALPKRRNPRIPAIAAWSSLAEPACLDGSSPRYATLEGPSSLRSCGVGSGYGWYRIRFRQPKSAAKEAKVQIDLPQAGDRLRIHLDGRLLGIFGEGPGASPLPLSLKLSAGEHTLAVLAEHVGRFADGHGAEQRSGLWGPIWETVPLEGVKVAPGEAPHFNPFRLRGFMPGLVQGEAPPETGIVATFTHRRRTPLLLDLGSWPVPTTLLLGGAPLRRLSGDPSCRCVELLRPELLEGAKGGRHTLCIVPDHDHEFDLKAASKQVRIWECRREIGEANGWAFARRPLASEVLERTDWQPVGKEANRRAGSGNAATQSGAMPTWFRASVSIPPQPGTLELDLSSMSRGEAYFDGEPLGAYFSRTGDGKAVGPATLPVPGELLRPGETQEILLFDEEGFSPRQVRLINV